MIRLLAVEATPASTILSRVGLAAVVTVHAKTRRHGVFLAAAQLDASRVQTHSTGELSTVFRPLLRIVKSSRILIDLFQAMSVLQPSVTLGKTLRQTGVLHLPIMDAATLTP